MFDRIRVPLLFVLLVIAAPAATADTISIRADEWLPYNGATSRNPAGYMIEMADAIAKANGHTIDYRTMPWKDALEATRKGDHDCVVGALKSDAEGFAFAAKPWGKSQNAFYGLNDSAWKFESLDSLSNVRLAVIEGYSYTEELDAYIAKYKADPKRIVMVKPIGRAIVNMISQVSNKRADVLIDDVNVVMNAVIKLELNDRIVQLGVANQPNEIYVACTPANPKGKKYADMFSAGTEQLRKSGQLDAMLRKYLVPDWQK